MENNNYNNKNIELLVKMFTVNIISTEEKASMPEVH